MKEINIDFMTLIMHIPKNYFSNFISVKEQLIVVLIQNTRHNRNNILYLHFDLMQHVISYI